MYNTRVYNSTICIKERGRATCTDRAGRHCTEWGKMLNPAFCTFAGIAMRGCIFIFSSTPRARISYSTSISHSTAPLSYFPKSTTNLIPKPFFAHNSLPIHHHFPSLTPHSHLFHAHSISFQSHSFYH